MKFDRGTIFLTIASLILIALLITLAAAIVTGPAQPSLTPGDKGELLGETGSQPEFARPIMKDPNYPGISTKYETVNNRESIGMVQGQFAGQPVYARTMTLNGDGTISLTVNSFFNSFNCGHWYKIAGKGHTVYLKIDGGPYTLGGMYQITLNGVAASVEIENKDGKDHFNFIGSFTGGSYNNWDAGYANMSLPVSSLGQYIDCCIPPDTARPYVEKGLTGDQGVPYMAYNMPPETADNFAKRGIPGDLCGPYYAAGVSLEDTIAYLDSGFTAEQIMPYARARVHESDVMTYLNAGVTYDRAKPYIDAKALAGAAAPYAASMFPADQCMPFVNAGTDITKARPFLLFNIPADQAVVYINNGISATTAKPYVDAGVPAEKAVDEIKKGIPPTV